MEMLDIMKMLAAAKAGKMAAEASSMEQAGSLANQRESESRAAREAQARKTNWGELTSAAEYKKKYGDFNGGPIDGSKIGKGKPPVGGIGTY
jgi:hypothetical protein